MTARGRPFVAPVLGLLACLVVLMLAHSGWAQDVPEPGGYRLEDYRSPTPATLRGATVLDVAAAIALWKAEAALFIDVLPRPPKPANLAPGTVWRDPSRNSLPGAIWLPNVGFGALAPETEAYFAAGLARATGEDRSKAVVFFCERHCWMSWNAAKRAIAMGYAAVSWFPDGTTGWSEAGLPLAPVEPWREGRSSGEETGR
jgi:PQQ-dependent catabolism-associated CXXCW motif protein